MKHESTGVKPRRSFRNLKTATNMRVRSKPSVEGQRYLDLYVLQRERVRWNRLRRQSEQMIEGIDKAIRKLGFPREIIEDDAEPPAGGQSLRFRNCPKKKRSA